MRQLGLIVAAGAAAVVAGCGSSSAPPAGAGKPVSVEIRGFVFHPARLEVAAGSRVTWTNRDSSSHTATASAGGFDTGTLSQGQAKAVVLSKPGTYAYYCQLHPFMKATVVVRGK